MRVHSQLALLGWLIVPTSLFAQDVPRWEIGPGFSWISSGVVFERNSELSLGGRAVLNVSKSFGVDLQAGHASRTESSPEIQSEHKNRLAHFTGNFKATLRRHDRIQPFALAGIGKIRERGKGKYSVPFSGTYSYLVRHTLLRFGGGVEIVPSHRFAVRIDVSDLAVRLPESNSGSRFEIPARFNHHLEAGLSIMFRFGRMGSN